MEYFDEYDYYNFDFVVNVVSILWKGRIKCEVNLNMNWLNFGGYEWKVMEKLRNIEKNRNVVKGLRFK